MSVQVDGGEPAAFKPKKSVALSGTAAGNTAICTVGQSGNDLHYRGYDIADLAAHCEFEEVAYLLVHGKLPNAAELAAYKALLVQPARFACGGEAGAGAAARVQRTPWTCCAPAFRCWAACGLRPSTTAPPGARDIADALLASLPSMLLYWHHFARNGKRIALEADGESGEESIAAHFLHLLHGKRPARSGRRPCRSR